MLLRHIVRLKLDPAPVCLKSCHPEMLLRANKWPLWSLTGGGWLESHETRMELFVSTLIRRTPSSWYQVL